jgi:hypothetical protein
MINNIQNMIVLFAAAALIALFSGSIFATTPPNDNFANAETLSGIQVHIVRNNIGATKEPGEPDHAYNPGGRSVWFKWVAPRSGTFAFTTNRSETNIDTLINVYRGSALNDLQNQSFSNDISGINLRSFCRSGITGGTTYYIAIDGSNDGQNIAEGTFMFDIQPSFNFQGADYDSDGMTDISVFRPSTGMWYSLNSSSQQMAASNWGTNGDIPIVASIAGSGANRFTVFRPSTGMWYSQSCCNPFSLNWGTDNDIPVPSNYGAGSNTDFAVFRPSTGTWYIYYSPIDQDIYQFGAQGDIPVPGHYSPDASADIAVFRPSTGVWYFRKRINGNHNNDQFSSVKFGQTGDKPVPADYDGDGILDVAVYRPSAGTWWVLRSSDNQVQAFQWGVPEDIPTTGDFDGDGIFDYAVFRPSNGFWYIHRSSDGLLRAKQFGLAGDIPVTANKTF